MERIIFFVFFVPFLIMSVKIEAQRDLCRGGLGTCENCDQKCKTKYGSSCQGSCDHSVGVPLCTCIYPCPPPLLLPLSSPPPKTKTCNSGTTLCNDQCSDHCCDTNCAKSHKGGHGVCNSLGNSRLCLCQYPC